LEGNDSFGFLAADGYVTACGQDDLVHVKDKGYIFAMHKELDMSASTSTELDRLAFESALLNTVAWLSESIRLSAPVNRTT